VWTGTLVDVLGALGVEDRNARQAIARTAGEGRIVAERHGRLVQWRLSDQTVELLEDGTKRIYGFGATDVDWNRRWLVVLCPVPEEQRVKRQQLRARLGFAGFGFLGPSVAISPHLDRERLANAALRDLQLEADAVVFRAEGGEMVEPRELLRRAWDLDQLELRYRRFLDRFDGRRPQTPDSQLVALTELVHEWRHFPFVDPEIPTELLPAGWPLSRAKQLFDSRHESWSAPAVARFDELDQR